MSAGPRDRPRPVAGLGWRHRLRGTTALQAVATAALLAAPVPAVAGGLSPNAQPTGGQVVAGQAGIAQSVTSTVVTQSSQRAAVNWQSFDVGSSQTVQFVQPNASSATLNRVVGPNPSEIAGKINANGQIVVVNQAGVVFDRGAQINATGIVVSAAGISNANFMAGKMVFDEAADPNAKIVNHGSLTVGQHGLAALVAPQVRNAGVIRAPLGTVIMAGAETDTLDLYGDGLVSINVTKQVTQAPDGGRALVTNAGVVSARGGAVVLTADAVDGVVQTLVDAGGRISANSAAGRTGRVLISGAGGDVRVEGAVSAQGNEPGTTGGEVRVSGSRGTVVGAHAQINASGQAGGGVVALGTTLARAKSGSGIAAATTKALAVKPGAVISANATARGNGGRVVGLSAGTTTVAGTIDAMGGPAGGNGGFVETSGATVNLGAALVDTLAPMGTAGSWLLDPSDFTVQTMAQADQIATDLGLGNVEIQTTSGAAVYPPGTGTETSPGTGNITISYAISAPSNVNTLEFDAYNSILIDAPVNVGTAGTLQLIATNGITQNAIAVITAGTLTGSAGTAQANIGIATNFITNLGAFTAPMAIGVRDSVPTLTVTGTVNGGIGTYIVNTGGALAIQAPVISTNVVALTTSGGITESGSGEITSPRFTGSAGGDVVLGGSNNVTTLGAFTATGHGFTLADPGAALLTVNGPVDAATVSLTAPAIDIPMANAIDGTTSVALTATGTGGTGDITEDGTGSITTPLLTGMAAGTATLDGSNAVDNLGAFMAITGLTLNDSAMPLTVTGTVGGGTGVSLTNNTGELLIHAPVSASGTVNFVGEGVTQNGAGVVTAGTLTGDAGDHPGNIGIATNDVTNLGTFTALMAFGLRDSVPTLTVTGTVNGGIGVYIVNSGGALSITAPLTSTNVVALTTSGGITESGLGTISSQLLFGSAGGDVMLGGDNDVATLGSFTATGHGFTLADPDAPLLTVNGPVNAATVSLTAPVIDISKAGAIDGTTSIALATTGTGGTGTITEDGTGSITTPLLTGNATGDVTMDGANDVGSIGTFTATGYGFTLLDGGATLLTVNGPLDAATVALTAPTIDIPTANAIDGTTSIALTTTGTGGTGTITEDGTGSITTPLLTGSATGDVTLDNSSAENNVGSIGMFTATGYGFTLLDGGATLLTVNGPLDAATVALTAPTIDIPTADAIDGTTSIALTTTGTGGTGTITEDGTGSITTPLLTGSATGDVTLDNSSGGNNVGSIGMFTATGYGFTLLDGGAALLTVNGPLDAATVALTAPTIDIPTANAIDGTTSIALTTTGTGDTGTITEDGTGSITTPLLTGNATGDVTLDNSSGGNNVGSIGMFTATGYGFTLLDGGAALLTVNGPLDAATVALTAPTIDIPTADAIDGTTSIALTTTGTGDTGTITEDGTGSITTSLLTGNATGDVTLDGANDVGAIGTFTATGYGFTLLDGGATLLTVNGPLDAATVALTAPTIDIPTADAIDGTTSIALTTTGTGGTGTITEDGTGSITTPLLSGSATGDVTLDNASNGNNVGSIGMFTATGYGFTLLDGGATLLTVNGPLDAATVALTAPTIDIPMGGAIDGTTSIALTTTGTGGTGTITEDGTGNITTALLTGNATGSVTLDGANNVGTLGAFSAGDTFTLNDTFSGVTVLTVDGPVSAGAVSLDAAAIDIPLAGAIDGSVSVALSTAGAGTGTGAFTEDGTGTIKTPLLTGNTAGNVTLDGPNNIGTLGMFSAGSVFTLNDTDPSVALLTVDGPLSAGMVTLNAPAIDIPTVNAITGTVSIALDTNGAGTGAITEDTTGTITTPELTGSTTGNATLDGPNNVGTLGMFSAGSVFTLIDTDPSVTLLTVNGPLTAGAVTLNAPAIDIPTAGAIDATTSIALTTTGTGGTGTITEDGTGSITTPLLTGSATGDVTLDNSSAENNVGSIGSFTATGYGFTLLDGGATLLTVNGPLDAATVALTAPTIDIPTANAIDGTTSIALNSTDGAGTITEDGTGSITTPLLTGSAAGDVTLDGPNDVDAVGSFTATGFAFTLTDPNAALLTVNGPLDAATVALTAPAIDIPIPSAIDGTTSVALTATGIGGTGDITEDGTGSITTALLTGTANDSATLDGDNDVGTIGGFTAGNLFTMTDGAALTVQGPVQSLNGNVYLIDSNSGGITFADGGSLESVSGGTIGLRTDFLANLGTPAATGTANAGTGTFEIAPFTSGNSVTLGAEGIVAESLSLPTVTGITADTIRIGEVQGVTTAGSILVTGPFDLAGDNLDLESLGVVTESGPGTLTTPLLTGNAGGAVTLGGDNDVGTLGQFSATGFAFTLADAGAPLLTVDGPVDAATVSLTAPVMDIPMANAIDGTTSVALTTTGGNITEDGTGSITTPLLTGMASGSATLDGDNTVTDLGPFTASKGFTLNDGVAPLTVVGAVDGGTGVTLTNTGALAIDAAVSATGTVDLTAAGITQTAAGVVTAGLLTGTTGGDAADFGTAANLVTDLGPFTANAGFTLNNATSALTVVGEITGGPFVTLINTGSLAIDAAIDPTNTVTLIANGITQTAAGVITAETLTGSAGNGAADLGTAVNLVTNLGAFTATKGFNLNDKAATLTVIGAVDGGTRVTLTNTGALVIDAPVTGSGTVDLTAEGISQDAAGVITAGTLEGSSGADSTDLGTAVNIVANLGPFTAGGSFSLLNDPTLVVVGNVTAGTDVTITVAGSGAGLEIASGVTVQSGFASTVALTANAGQITNGGTVSGGILASLTAGTDIDQNGFVTADAVTETAADNLNQNGVTSATAGNATLAATTGELTQNGTVTASGSVTLTAVEGIDQNGLVSATSGTVGMTSGRFCYFSCYSTDPVADINQYGIVTAGGDVTLSSYTGTVAQYGSITSGGSISLLSNFSGVEQFGSVTAQDSVTFTAGYGQLLQAGTVKAVTGSATLIDLFGNLTQSGRVTAATDVSLTDTGGTLTQSGVINAGGDAILSATAGYGPNGIPSEAYIQNALIPGGDLVQSGVVTAVGDVTLMATNGNVTQTQTGSVTAGGDAVFTTNVGTIEQDGAVTGGNAVTFTAGKNIVQKGLVSAQTGDATLIADDDLSQAGSVTAAMNVSLTAQTGKLTQTGDVTAGGSADLTATAGALTNGGTVKGSALADLTAGTDITQSGLVTAATVTETAGGNFTQTGTGTTTATAGAATLTATTGTLTQNGTVTAAADAILTATTGTLDQNGSVTAAGSATLLAATDLSQTGKVEATAGSATLTATGGTLVQSGSIGAGQSVTLSSASDMTVTGPVNAAAGNASFTAGDNYTQSSVVGAGVDVLITAQGSLTENGSVTAGNDASLTAVLGTLAQNGTVGAGGNAFLAATNGTLDQTGHVTAGNTATLAAGIDLSQTGTVNAITDTLFAAGNLTQAGSVNASGNATLTAANGTLDQTGSVTAGGNADLTATNGVLDQGGDVTANGAVDLTAGTDLSQTGIVHAFGGDADLTAGQDLTQSHIVTASADVMLTAQGGNLSQTGSVTAGTSAIIQALVGNLTEGGIVTAPNIQVSAPDGTVDFSGSFAGVVPDPTLNPNLKLQKGSFPTDTSIGAWISASTIAVAPSAVVTGAGGGRSQLVISLTSPNGSVSFGNFNNQQTDLYLDLGTGFASGQIEVEALQVEYTPPGTARTINLLGTVNGQSASTAATASFIQPLTKANYQVNGCAIESTSCIRIATIVLPTINPLKDLEVETPLQADDILVILPDVGERDY